MIVSLLLIATDRFYQYHQQNICHHISLFLITVSKSFLILFFLLIIILFFNIYFRWIQLVNKNVKNKTKLTITPRSHHGGSHHHQGHGHSHHRRLQRRPPLQCGNLPICRRLQPAVFAWNKILPHCLCPQRRCDFMWRMASERRHQLLPCPRC